jgi:hypothetical protein
VLLAAGEAIRLNCWKQGGNKNRGEGEGRDRGERTHERDDAAMVKEKPAKRWVLAQFSSDESVHGVRTPIQGLRRTRGSTRPSAIQKIPRSALIHVPIDSGWASEA